MKQGRLMDGAAHLMSAAQAGEITLTDLTQSIKSGYRADRGMKQGQPVLEFYGGGSWIVPVAIVALDVTTDFPLYHAEAGPGQNVSADTLLAFEMVTKEHFEAYLAAHCNQPTSAQAAKAYQSEAAGMGQRTLEVTV